MDKFLLRAVNPVLENRHEAHLGFSKSFANVFLERAKLIKASQSKRFFDFHPVCEVVEWGVTFGQN